jgi:hypothetical protein
MQSPSRREHGKKTYTLNIKVSSIIFTSKSTKELMNTSQALFVTAHEAHRQVLVALRVHRRGVDRADAHLANGRVALPAHDNLRK